MSNIPPSNTLDINDVPQSDDGGATNLIGLEYQYHYAVKRCIEMLRHPGSIEYVACELQDDIAVKKANGCYCFHQAKQKRDGLWTISLLSSEGVWRRFWNLSQNFGPGQEYAFVSDQESQLRTNKQPDLLRLKQLVDKGRTRCSDTEIIEADILITRLMTILGVKDKEAVTDLFWNLRILTGLNRLEGQFYRNLSDLELLLLSRHIESDQPSRINIYRNIIGLFHERVAEPPPEMTAHERLEYRKICAADVEQCVTGPYKQARVHGFEVINSDEDNRTLTSKMHDAHFPMRLIRYFLETRNLFEVRYRQDRIHADRYISGLRMAIWTVCNEQSSQSFQEYQAAKAYRTICDELRRLAVAEALLNPPIKVDFEYLHGMLCQLTAECNNEWTPI